MEARSVKLQKVICRFTSLQGNSSFYEKLECIWLFVFVSADESLRHLTK